MKASVRASAQQRPRVEFPLENGETAPDDSRRSRMAPVAKRD